MRVLVVGGGITGLTAAWVLGRAGVPTLLVEAAPRLGGKVRTEHTDGFVVEHGPDSFLAARPAAVQLARELGLGDVLIGTTEPRTVWILHRDRLVRMPEGLGLVLPTRVWPFAKTRLFSPLEKLRMGLDLVRPRCIAPGDEAVGTFLRRRLGDAVVDRLAGPLLGGIYGTPIDELSLDAVVPQLRTSEREHRSLLFAGLAQGRAARRIAAEAAAGASSAAPRARPLGMFASLAGGTQQLIDGLVAAIGALGDTVEVRPGVAVRSLERFGPGAVATLSDGSRVRADAVILATPAPVTAALLESALPEAARPVGSIPHGLSLTVTLVYREADIGEPPVGHGFLVPPAEGRSIMACTWSSQKWAGRAPAGTLLLRTFFLDSPAVRAATDETVLALARRDVEQILRISGEPVLSRVVRWEAAMPRYTVGHLERVAAAEAATAAWPAIVLAGAPYHGVGLPDCVTQARVAAATVMNRLDPASANASA
jgi:protoporphyrinogen/coproporphyrinogen III oxidase